MSTPQPVRLYEPVPGDRAAWWERLRGVYGEIAPAELEPGVRAWLVLSHGLNQHVLSQDGLFSRDPRRWRDMRDGTIPAGSGIRAAWQYRPNVLFSDGGEHRRLSRALIEAFGRLDDRRIHAQIQQVSGDLVRGFAAQGEADLVAAYARPLPLMVMGRLFGLDGFQISQLIHQTTRTWQGDPRAAVEMGRLLHEVVDDAREHRDESALPTLLLDQGLTRAEAAAQLGLLLAAGVDPVTHAISTALHRMLADPEVVRVRYTLRVSEMVNLLMARHSPLETMVARYALQDVRLGGHPIRAGDCIVAGYAAASQDLYSRLTAEEIAANRAHLTWGVGVHRCPHYAQDIAVTLIEAALTTVLDLLPDMVLARRIEPSDRLATVNYQGFHALPVVFSPQSSPAPPTAREHPERRPDGPPSPPPRRWGLRALLPPW